MSVEHVKQVVGRAMLDPQFRSLLLNDPAQALQGFQLTGEEMQALGNLTPEKLQALHANLIAGLGGDSFVKGADSFYKDNLVKGEDLIYKDSLIKGEDLLHKDNLSKDGFLKLSTANQVSEVQVRGYDPENKKNIVGVSGPRSSSLGKRGGGVLAILIGLLLFAFLLLFLFLSAPSSLIFAMFGGAGFDPASLGDGSVIPACDGSVMPAGAEAGGPSPHMLPAVQSAFLMVNNLQMQMDQPPMMCKSSYGGSSALTGPAAACGDQCATGEWCVANSANGCAIYCQDADQDGTCEGYRCVDANNDHVCDLIDWTTCSDAPPGVVCSPSAGPQGTCGDGLTCAPNDAGASVCGGDACQPTDPACSPTTCGDQKCDPNCENGTTCPKDCPTPVPPSSTTGGGTTGGSQPTQEPGLCGDQDVAYQDRRCVCPGVMAVIYYCGTDPAQHYYTTNETCTPTESCAPPEEPTTPAPTCQCVFADPCKTAAVVAAASCPGYYDTCTGAQCRP